MSAIFGVVQSAGEPAAEILERMGGALTAFGPVRCGAFRKGPVGLGYRLLPFTPEDEFDRQPCVARDGTRALVFAGRLDNREDLLAALKDNAIAQPAVADSDLVWLAWERWGQATPEHLVGDFAFAAWDGRAAELLLACSPTGEQTLYYCRHNDTFAFATQPKGLFALPGLRRQIDEQTIADYLVLSPATQGRSFYRGITRLEPGTSLLLRNMDPVVTRFWNPTQRELRLNSDEQYVEAFNEIFTRVIRAHIRSSSAVGVSMSGGFDSTGIAAVASELSSHSPIHTFTEVPSSPFEGTIVRGRYADETPFVQAMARMHPSLNVHFVRTRSMYLDDLESYFGSSETPFPNASNRPWVEELNRQAAASGVRTLLTGGGGNLTITWNGAGLLPELIRNGKWLRAWREAVALGRWRGASPVFRPLIGEGLVPLLPHAMWRGWQWLRRRTPQTALPWEIYSPIRADFAEQQRVQERAMGQDWDFTFHFENATQARVQTIVMGGHTVEVVSGMRASFGVQNRHPAFDTRLTEFCLSVPEEQWLRMGQDRWLFRRAMAKRLPQEVLNNRLRGLQAAEWLQRLQEAQPRLVERLAELRRSPLASAVIDLDRLDRLTEALPKVMGGPEEAMLNYRVVFEKGIMTACFLQWVERNG